MTEYFEMVGRGLCPYCKAQPAAEGVKSCVSCREKQSKYDTARCKEAKEKVLSHYGHVCKWPGCEQTDSDILTLDHIYDDGAQERRELGNISGSSFYLHVVRNGFPEGRYQLLCHNHQWKKRMMISRNEELPAEVRGGN